MDRAQAETIEREAFGFSLPNLPRLFGREEGEGGEVSALELELASVERRPDGRSVFTMSNGQVWTQVEADRVRGLGAGARVTIRRAAMGSFLMTPDNGGEAIRVRRTQ